MTRLGALEDEQRELWSTLRDENDPERRMSLLSTFSENRAAIEELSAQLGIEPQAGAGQAYRVEIVGDADQLRSTRPSREPSLLPFGDGPGIPPPPVVDKADKATPSSTTRSSARQLFLGLRDLPARMVLIGGTLVALLGLAWLLTTLPSDDSAQADESSSLTAETVVAGPSAEQRVEEITAVLRGLGAEDVVVADRDGVLHLLGTVSTDADREVVVGAVRAMAGEQSLDDSALVVVGVAGSAEPVVAPTAGRPEALQAEIDRVIGATPIIFGSGGVTLSDLQVRILNNIASIMLAYQDLPVTIVGFTDDTGSDESNRELSLARAESVLAYLVAQGVPEALLTIEPRGEDTSSGSSALANLERRVEFEVSVPAAAPAAPADSTLRIAIVAPSARNDLAFTQSMVDAVAVIAAERGDVEVAITDNTFVPDEAAAAIKGYAEQGYDLVIAHGSQFGAALIDIAPKHPDVAFAWGTASDTFGLPNVYAYDAKAGHGGYVMGAIAARLTQTGVVGVIGPIEVGDAQLYVNGFRAGAVAESPPIDVRVAYTGSFSDVSLAAETAQGHLAAGSDVMTGSAQMVVGAVSAASEAGALWFGTQANQASLAPSLVVASQVYHWEVILRPIVAAIDQGTVASQALSADLGNGGLVIEYNPEYPLPDPVRQRADQISEGIKNGSVVVPAG